MLTQIEKGITIDERDCQNTFVKCTANITMTFVTSILLNLPQLDCFEIYFSDQAIVANVKMP